MRVLKLTLFLSFNMKLKPNKRPRAGFLLSIIFFSAIILHPFYLSVTEIKYNGKEGRVEVSVKMFLNDFENALKKINHETIDLIHPKDSVKLRSQINEYIRQRLQIQCDKKNLDLSLLGFERDEENFWIYCESEKLPAPKSVIVSNGLLYDFLKEQMNIIRVKIGEAEKSLKIRNPERRAVFQF